MLPTGALGELMCMMMDIFVGLAHDGGDVDVSWGIGVLLEK